MAFRIFVGILLFGLFATVVWIAPPTFLDQFADDTRGWVSRFFQVAIPVDTLIEINTTGLGVLVAGIALRFSPLGEDFGIPAQAGSSDRTAWAIGTRNAAFRAMTIFGVCCLFSTIGIALDRQLETAVRDQTIMLAASDLTVFGLLLALVSFAGSTIRVGTLVGP